MREIRKFMKRQRRRHGEGNSRSSNKTSRKRNKPLDFEKESFWGFLSFFLGGGGAGGCCKERNRRRIWQQVMSAPRRIQMSLNSQTEKGQKGPLVLSTKKGTIAAKVCQWHPHWCNRERIRIPRSHKSPLPLNVVLLGVGDVFTFCLF